MSGQQSRDGWFRGPETGCTPDPAATNRVSRLIQLGPPGVGKGTQAELLCERLRACHLSTGDLFRAAKCDPNPTPAMKSALDAMRRGELVSDELVIAMVRERTSCLRCRGGFLLDGVPRTIHQARSLDALLGEIGVELDAVLSYELPLEEIVDRIGGRRICSVCKSVYHISGRPPATDGVCDQCGAELLQREDDHPAAVRVRMETYLQATAPLIEYYRQRRQLVAIPALGTPDQILRETLQRLATRTQLAREQAPA